MSSGPRTSKTARLETIRWMSLYVEAPRPAALASFGPTPVTTSTFSTKTRGECFGTQYDVRLLTVLPGAPRLPRS